MPTLSVGCGHKPPQPDLIRLDISAAVNPDVVWDLGKTPYPFEDSSFSAIECFDVIEHLDSIPTALAEFHRILEPGGILKLTTPHFSCANSYIDPTHRWHLSYFSFDYFSDSHELSYYSNARYRIKHRCIHFRNTRLNRTIVTQFANKHPRTYEQRWAWTFPAWYLSFELETAK
jgi:SAM-dependent methyltransferase